MGNSLKVQVAIDAAFKKMMSWPRWYFNFRIWWQRYFGKHHWTTSILQELGWFDQFVEKSKK